MTDLETAVNSLGTHSVALCKNGKVITSDKHGVAPLTELIESGTDNIEKGVNAIMKKNRKIQKISAVKNLNG